MTDASALLAPGGRHLVVGLAAPVSAFDRGWDLVSLLVDPLVGLVEHPRASTGPPAGPP